VRADRGTGLGQTHAVRGVVGAGPGDDAGAVADGIEYRLEKRDLLVVGGGRRLTGGPGDDQTVTTGFDQVIGYLLGSGQINRAVRAERRHHGSQHAAQARADVDSSGAHGRQITRWYERFIHRRRSTAPVICRAQPHARR
jgi:hypothetical protein